MGFFSKIFNGRSELEIQLEKLTIDGLLSMGMSESEAKQMSKNLIADVQQELKDSPDLPVNFGDYLLENESVNEKISNMLSDRRKLGVSDQEIREWWNKSPLERGVIRKTDEMFHMTVFMWAREQGMSPEEASAHVKKSLPMFSESDLDNYLPYEWKEKVNVFITEYVVANKERSQAEARQFNTLNEYLLSKIR